LDREFLCSQVRPAVYEKVSIEAEAEGIMVETVLYRLIEAGFLRLYRKIEKGYGFPETTIPDIRENMELPIQELAVESDTTKPPGRYTEGSLIRALKEKGIGRPSTYSPTIEKIRRYRYVTRKGRTLHPTDRGKGLCRYLQERYEQVADLAYTSGMEQGLDRVAAGELGSETFLEKEWRWLEPAYRRAQEEGWLDSDLPSRHQTDFLQRLAEEAGEEVPEEVWLSAKLTGEWIARLLREQPLKLRLSQVTGPQNVRGVPCYSLFVSYNRSMPGEETAFLKGRRFRYVSGSADERPAYRLCRQNRAKVEDTRNLLIRRYTARAESWLEGIEIEVL
jgi:hypothetical protein